MREHMGLFRGKRIDNGEWVEGAYCFTGRYHVIIAGRIEEQHIIYGHYSVCVPMYVVDPDTVGECTGLGDKNGKLIFEGDVVEKYSILGELTYIGVVKWTATFSAWHIDNSRTLYGDGIASYIVIGNIHDNPELKGGEGDD